MPISTEIQRIVLLVALAVLGYMLVRAWDEDYGRAAKEAVERRAPAVETGDASLRPAPAVERRTPVDDIPASVDRPAGDDVPTVVDVPPVDDVPGANLAGTPSAAAPLVDEQQLVRVVTPLMELWIDRMGGDVVGLELREHMARLPDAGEDGTPVRILERNRAHTYIAQSGLRGRDGRDKAGSRPLYAASASDYSLSPTDEEAPETLEVVLRHQADDVELIKRFRFASDQYLIAVEHEVVNRGESPFQAGLFAQLKRDGSRPEGGMFMGPRPYVGAAFTTEESRYEKVDFEDIDEGLFRAEVQGGWAAILQHYFLSSWIGDKDEVNAYYGRRLSDRNYAVGYVGPEFVVPAGGRHTARASLYVGPKIQKRLEAAAPNLYLAVDYGILWWLSVPLFHVLDAIHSVVGNWGVSIVLLTLCVKILLYPLASAGFRSMAKMKLVAPQMKRLQERYSGDRQKLTQEMMALYRKEGANPFGGCLPLLAQMPVFLALYWVLYESVELRHAPFVLWIEDLTAHDPWYVLPLLYGASFYASQLLNPPPPDPMQARIIKLMPIFFTVLFFFFPAGLVLYWLVNQMLTLAQQWHITRRIQRGAKTKAAAKT